MTTKFKLLGIAALVLVAVTAGYAGSLLNTIEPAPVEAAKPRATTAVRIAVINLEEASRQSKWFGALKIDWENAQDDIKRQNEKMKADYSTMRDEYQRARLRGDDPDDLLSKVAEIKAMEEAQKAAMEVQKGYLQALLNQYQKDVLKKVMDELVKFVQLEGYDIVLQDYTLETEEVGFFTGGVYSQTLMSKPVLHAPGLKANTNAYVTDITQAIIDRIK
ncbi:MAG: hypothetical protein K8I27_13605 [Planctomycetes bacterium]|nr:hypothetical protein [Planctomycetota bacterium]